MWKIGNVEIKNQVILAPMAGISNPAYIKICEEMGASYAITELLSAEAIVRDNKKTLDMLKGLDTLNIPVAVQIFGSNPTTMARAAKKLVDLYHVSIIDINMGCPVLKVAVKNNAGSALMKDPIKAKEVVQAVACAVDVPVTVKIRSGWDSQSINAKEIAKVCEEAGAKAITVHPRTKTQGYSGKADWRIIKEVKESVSVPVIGNGDIKSALDAKKMLLETGCDAVMIGRAALGNPRLIKETVTYLETGKLLARPTVQEVLLMIDKHLTYLLQNKQERVAVLEMRSHIAWYLKGLPLAGKVKEQVFKAQDADTLRKIMEEYGSEVCG